MKYKNTLHEYSMDYCFVKNLTITIYDSYGNKIAAEFLKIQI